MKVVTGKLFDRSKKHVHFGGRFRRKVSVGTELGHSSNSQSGLSDILDWLRPRAFSDQAKHRRKSVDSNLLSASRASGSSRSSNSSVYTNKEPFVHSSEDINRPLFVDAKMATSWVNAVPQEYLYQRATLSADHLASKNSCRPRSNSEVGVMTIFYINTSFSCLEIIISSFIYFSMQISEIFDR